MTNLGISGICIQAGSSRPGGFDCPGWISAGQRNNPGGVNGGQWGKPNDWRRNGAPPVVEDRVTSPSRSPGNGSGFPFPTNFPIWQLGSGGPAAGVFDPPGSFWGVNSPEAGGQWNWLTSITYTASARVPLNISDPIDLRNPPIVQGFYGNYWGGWTFAVNSTMPMTDRSSNGGGAAGDGGVRMGFSKGGYQEARGAATGAESFIENARSLLDAPREWYADFDSGMLFYKPNSTDDAPPPSSGWVASHLETVLLVKGTQASPVVGHQLIGVSVQHTAPVFLKQYMASLSEGDWAIRPTGAVMLTGVKNALVQHCEFNSVGGNGLFIGGFARNTTVADNEFVWIGESAIASIGTTVRNDGTGGDQPRGNVIVRNLIHEVGIFGNQTAGYVQAMTAQTVVKRNILFNGPRAGINFLDGFGGGSVVEENLAFNWVRETGDHGPINTWDRQAFLTELNTGTPSLIPLQNNVTRNFLLDGYSASFPIDHDDGSAYYFDSENLIVYGGYKNFLGHSKVSTNNLYIYPDRRSFSPSYVGQLRVTGTCVLDAGVNRRPKDGSGWGEVWDNNTCIFGGGSIGLFAQPPHILSARGNRYLVPEGSNVTLELSGQERVSLAAAQKMGVDVGSTVGEAPNTATVIALAKARLCMVV